MLGKLSNFYIVESNGELGGMRTMKILFVADHTLFRDGVKLLLKQSNLLEQAEDANGLQAALTILGKERFDLILLDIKLRDAIGLDSLREIRKLDNKTPVITITDDEDFHLANQAIAHGASGYISKTSSSAELVDAISAAYAGKTYLAPDLSQHLNFGAPPNSEVSDISILASLSDRQREVLCHIARGSSNKAISAKMNISQNTVKAHLATIFKILGVHNRTEAFYFAARAGMPLE